MSTAALKLSQDIGDSRSHQIAMTWLGAPFDPTSWGLVWTAKLSPSDSDLKAKIQKASGAGIATALVGGAWFAYIQIVPVDTASLPAITLHWDIQAQHLSNGEVRTVAKGALMLSRDITRETTTSIPVFTTEEPTPLVVPGAVSYTHTQSSASDTWVINHNLGYRPVIELLTTGAVEMEGGLVHPTVNQAIASFSTPIAGTARCI